MNKLEELYQEIADLTKPKCLECKSGFAFRCCDRMYCEIAKEYAKEQGVELTFGDNVIPFLDNNNNCIVPPHLRPLCTLHNCKINSVGCTDDIAWDEKYFSLREQIEMHEISKYEQSR